ncbi:MAG TPA: histidine phosphatase family protein [Candidatus Paceibacterota bacterium]|nr:histidine phosphatase family protein [Candidatus Paceibacterota bacterium]
MKIYVIRHGLTEMNKQGLINGSLHDTLAPEGFEQAKQAALSLPNTIKRIYSSSLNRAKQTAQVLNDKLGVDLTHHDELKEVNFGILEGTPFLEEHKERHKKQDYDWGPSGEKVEDVKRRVLSILEKIKSENSDGEALIVAHGGIVRMLQFLETNEAMEEIGNASVHAFDLDKILK